MHLSVLSALVGIPCVLTASSETCTQDDVNVLCNVQDWGIQQDDNWNSLRNQDWTNLVLDYGDYVSDVNYGTEGQVEVVTIDGNHMYEGPRTIRALQTHIVRLQFPFEYVTSFDAIFDLMAAEGAMYTVLAYFPGLSGLQYNSEDVKRLRIFNKACQIIARQSWQHPFHIGIVTSQNLASRVGLDAGRLFTVTSSLNITSVDMLNDSKTTASWMSGTMDLFKTIRPLQESTIPKVLSWSSNVPKVILSLPFGDPPLNQHIFDSSSASSEHQYLLFMFGHIAAELSQSMEFLLLDSCMYRQISEYLGMQRTGISIINGSNVNGSISTLTAWTEGSAKPTNTHPKLKVWYGTPELTSQGIKGFLTRFSNGSLFYDTMNDVTDLKPKPKQKDEPAKYRYEQHDDYADAYDEMEPSSDEEELEDHNYHPLEEYGDT
eukprot:m.199715 g.199715  ORF g.199715 m.199715 type:complete len:432 (-) comp15729_c0_seq3:99-1394(-)